MCYNIISTCVQQKPSGTPSGGILMFVNKIHEIGCVVPERAPKRLDSGTISMLLNGEADGNKRYLLYSSKESFEKAYDTEEYRHSLNYKSLEHLQAPILDKISNQTWKDSSDIEIPVAGRKCCCHSVWCPTCFRYLYLDKIKKTFAPYDWRFTRQVVLTIDPANFPSPVEALTHIRQKRSVGEFVRRLRHGVREKIGKEWRWKYKPIKIVRWAWFLEWHSNGFPHFHVFLMLDKEGKSGMIGNDFLRDSWSLSSWVREEYFHSEKHFKTLTGYYADKGYFEKDKKHQGILPDVIMDNIKGKIKRYGSSEQKEKKKKSENINLEHNYCVCIAFFKNKANQNKIKNKVTPSTVINSIATGLADSFQNDINDRSIQYRVILEKCGSKTMIELDLRNYRLLAECNIPYDQWKSKAEGEFVNGRGIIRKLNLLEITDLLSSVTRVIYIKEYMDIHDYCLERSKEIQDKEFWRNRIMMDN